MLKENEKDDSRFDIVRKIRKDNVNFRKNAIKYFFDINDEVENNNLADGNDEEEVFEIESKGTTF